MSEEARPDCAQVSRFEVGDYMPPSTEAAADFERPTLLIPLRGSLTVIFGQSVLTLAEGAYRATSRVSLQPRSVFVADAPAGSFLALAVPRALEPCTLLTLRRVGERQHAALLQLREAAAMDAATATASAGRARLPSAGVLPVAQPPVPSGRWGAQGKPSAQPGFW